MNTPQKPRSKRKIGCGICLALLLILLTAGYMKCLRTTKRVFTRDNTALEKLPEGEAIPLMPDGRRVDYIRAYDLVYPDYRPDREDNALRDVVRFMGPGMFFCSLDFSDRTLEEVQVMLVEGEQHQRRWQAYCQRLGLNPEELTIHPSVLRGASPYQIIADRKYRQWAKILEAEGYFHEEDAAEDDMADYPVDDPPEAPPAPEPAPLYDVPESALEFPLPDDLVAELREALAEDGFWNAKSIIEGYYYHYGKGFSRPWSAAEYPEMAQWLEFHGEMLDVVAAAARQKVFLTPLVRAGDEPLMYSLLYDVDFLRSRTWMLEYRARMHIATGDAAAALSDIETVWRLGRHMAHQPHCLVVHLVGIAIQNSAGELARDLLTANICTPEQLRSLLAMLDTLPAPVASDDIMTVECFFGQEYIDLIPIRGMEALNELYGNNFPPVPTFIDPNYFADRYAVLRKTFSRLIVEGKYDEAEQHVLGINEEFRKKLHTILGVRARSEVCADLVYALMCPAVAHVFEARDRTERDTQLTRITIALKLYHADHGSYPDTLDALAPAYLPTLPAMPDAEKYPLTYTRKDAGFTLAAVEKDFDPESEGEEAEEKNKYGVVVKMKE